MAFLKISLFVAVLNVGVVLSYTKLGMEDGRLTDVQITASSCYDANHCTDRARLNQPAGGGKTGAWSARVNDANQFIQVDLRYLHEVRGVITQGRNLANQWVTSFNVHYSLDGLTWTPVTNALAAGSIVFDGNFDQETLVTNDFTKPVMTRFIRFLPVTFSGHISMRFEILGSLAPKIEGQEFDLGMKDEKILDSAISASSVYDANHGAYRARLDGTAAGSLKGAWSARTNDVNQWIKVDLGNLYLVTGLITQGRQDADQWVTSYTVDHSSDGTDPWLAIEDCLGDPQVFTGNTDRNSKVTTSFDGAILTRFVRIHPATWNGHISMRFEVLGRGPVAGDRFEPLALGMEDGRIADGQLAASTCYDSNHCTNRARLNQPAGNGQTGAWSALINDHFQWFEVDFGVDYDLKGVILQGRSDTDQWVTRYTVQYRPDGQATFTDVMSDSGAVKVFTGNTDRDSLVISMFPSPVVARFVRILPTQWHNHISMRFELLGDGPIHMLPIAAKLGIENGRVPTSSLSASSCWDDEHCVFRSRLNQPQVIGVGRGAWSARVNDVNQWIQVDLLTPFEVTGVLTQGRNEVSSNHQQWVTSYTIAYSIDGNDWITVEECESAEPLIFSGNTDRDGIVENPISPPVTARFFRLQPVTWHNHISLRWELFGEGPLSLAGASSKLGLEDYRIPDTSLTASSEHNSAHGPRLARLNLAAGGGNVGGWSALVLDHSQWLQIDLKGTYRVTGIMTQGRQDTDQWVTEYKVAHSRDGIDFTTVVSDVGAEVEFTGNTDRSTVVTNNFSPTLTTRFIRILPKMWHGHISMRVELLGAGPVAAILDDSVPLGIESYVVPDASMTASTEWRADHGALRGRLNLARVGELRGAWSARTNDVNQWIQVDLSAPFRIRAVITQGRQDVDQWVTAYKVGCSLDGTTFTTVHGFCVDPAQARDYAEQVFTANSDRNTQVINELPVPEMCRYVRLMPMTWHGHISLRMELLGEGPFDV